MMQCPDCSTAFTREGNLKRHCQKFHSTVHKNEIGDVSTILEHDTGEDFSFQHPFTMIVSGPTACGKTHFLKTMLQRQMVVPLPDTILWLYKRWQPLYDVIQNTVRPPVQFYKGIPNTLERDDFFDVNKRNVIVLDDLMSTASKDPRITDLFTEGSHHRNLSVIALNQNLYFSKDPTQRRNCHYLVLFDNPIDRQSIATLARQMYPTNHMLFMRQFEEGTQKPYGHLVVDLKPTTPEHLRLKTDVLAEKTIRGDGKPYCPQEPRAVQPYDPREPTVVQPYYPHEPTPESIHSTEMNPHFTYRKRKREEDSEEAFPSCADCGMVLSSTHDLQRHMKMWCPENQEKRESVTECPKPWLDTESLDGEKKVFSTIAGHAREENRPLLGEKMKKYMGQGISRDEACEKAEKKLEPADLKGFLRRYHILIDHLLNIRDGPVHKQVMEAVYDNVEDGHNQDKAIRMALKSHKNVLEDFMFETDDEDEDEGEEEEETDGADAENEEETDSEED